MPNLSVTWGIHDQKIRYSDIDQHWSFICSQWKYLGDKKLHHVSVLDDVKRFIEDHTDDYHVVVETLKFIETVDVLVGHNIKKHDIPKLKARIAKYNLPPMKEVIVIDTYQISKKFGFTSRKLGDLCEYLNLKHKKLSHEPDLFKKAANGCALSIKKLIRYGLGDLPATEDVFIRLKKYVGPIVNLNKFSDEKCCPDCGGKRFKCNGYVGTIHGLKREYKCLSSKCGRRFRDKKVLKMAVK
jgi:hypothetical protein